MPSQQNVVYLDVSTFGRLFDDARQPRILEERSAVLAIIRRVKSGHLQVATTIALEYEIGRNPNEDRRNTLLALLHDFGAMIPQLTEDVVERWQVLKQRGVTEMDAWHFAFAEHAKLDFVTCDDRLIRKIASIPSSVWCGTPIEYCAKENITWR